MNGGAAAPHNGHDKPDRPSLRAVVPLPTPQRLRDAWKAAEYRMTVLGWATFATWMTMGVGLVVGPEHWTSSPAYDLLRSLMPMWVWGWMFLGMAAVHIVVRVTLRRPCPAMLLGTMIASFWTGTFVVQACTGDLTAWTAAPAWGFLAVAQAVQNRWVPPAWMIPHRRRD